MFNRSTILGRLGADITINKTQTGKNVISFQIANDRPKVKGQERADTDWISCQAWNKTAELIALYFHKGDKILVSGRLQTREWKNRDGVKVTQTEIIVDTFESMTGRAMTKADSTIPSDNTDPTQSYISEPNFAEDFNTGPMLDINSDDLPF